MTTAAAIGDPDLKTYLSPGGSGANWAELPFGSWLQGNTTTAYDTVMGQWTSNGQGGWTTTGYADNTGGISVGPAPEITTTDGPGVIWTNPYTIYPPWGQGQYPYTIYPGTIPPVTIPAPDAQMDEFIKKMGWDKPLPGKQAQPEKKVKVKRVRVRKNKIGEDVGSRKLDI